MNEIPQIQVSDSRGRVVIVGGGPSGLMAAELLSAGGCVVDVYDRMPTVGRKLLMAGRGGLNLTHAEALDSFIARYGRAAERLRPLLAGFPPAALRAWADGLGQSTFTGSSGRVFPKAMKASPLLRAWLARLADQGVRLHTRHEWIGWSQDGSLRFLNSGDEVRVVGPDALVLALGGASWPGLGSNGAWSSVLGPKGVPLKPFEPANCGVCVNWSESFRQRFAGVPLKNVSLRVGGKTVRGEAMVASYGLEGGVVYAQSATIRDEIANHGAAQAWLDLRPDVSMEWLTARLNKRRQGESLSEVLRKRGGLTPVASNLLRESHANGLLTESQVLASATKSAPVQIVAMQSLDRAISSAGGVDFTGVTQDLELAALSGVYVAGEMLDWEAPTGGYLLQAAFATGVAAARAILRSRDPSAAPSRLSSLV